MSNGTSGDIHPTAIISPEAELADNVRIGPYVVIDGPVRLGPDCIIHSHALLCGQVTLGRGNQVFSGAVLGEQPQHKGYRNEPTSLEIGDNNTFREQVTIHRGTGQAGVTRIGHNNLFMANSHVAHDCVVGNNCIITNGALLGGHCVLEDNVYLSGNCAVHQFVRIGRLALLCGCSATNKDIPPFVIQRGFESILGINIVGMRRAGLSGAQIHAVGQAFRILFHQDLIMSAAISRMEEKLGTVDVVQEMIQFLKNTPRGINGLHHNRDLAA